MCALPANHVTGQRREAPFRRWVCLVPSMSDLAFLMPTLVLFWCTTGVPWLVTDSDTGWHIRTGEWILKNGRIPVTDLFSFTKSGERWFAWEWLADVSMAAVHGHLGLSGIVLLSLLVLGATSLWVYRSAVEESEHRLIAILLTGLAMAASTIHWLARPHLVTPLFATAFCWVLNRTKKRVNHDWLLLLLPALTTLWVNLHGGFFVGIILLMTYGLGTAAEELVYGTGSNTWARARKYVLTAGACAVLSLVNPYGYRLHVHVAQYLGSSFYLQRISEFQSADFHTFSAAYFETLLMLAIAAAVWHLGKGRLVHVLLLLSWAHLALFSVRNIPIFAVVSAPGIGLATRDWFELARTRFPFGWHGRVSANLVELEMGLRSIARLPKRMRWHLAPILVVLALAVSSLHPSRVRILQADFDRSRFPVEAATFLNHDDHQGSLRLFASWQWGGYLIYRLWPSMGVFDDGRTDFYGPRFVEEGLRVWEVRPDWAQILARYRVNAALVPVDSPLATVLRERADWKLVYTDRVALIFVKNEKTEMTAAQSREVVPEQSDGRGSYARDKGNFEY